MKSLKGLFALTFFALYMPIALAQSPVGDWTTVDDKTGKKRAVVRLVLNDKILTGTIIDVYPEAGDTGTCAKCPEPFKEQPIKGLQFLWGLKDRGDGVWEGGQVLEAKTGQIYRARLRVKGNKLYVRGYVGMVILGRTQVWIRA
ncbi:MAG TPA: DUF2147 domain-containing protein [Legionella sp.]|nr:DUF2147 domain-containing protein [Legionella sp.]